MGANLDEASSVSSLCALDSQFYHVKEQLPHSVMAEREREISSMHAHEQSHGAEAVSEDSEVEVLLGRTTLKR